MERRNTIQKDMVLNAVRNLKNHVTADEVYDEVKKDYPRIGKGTVYRNLNILADEGQIKRVELPDGAARFDHNLHEHYHVRCIHCGKIFDVEMQDENNLISNIKDTHGIEFLDYEVFFRGVCPECRKENNNL